MGGLSIWHWVVVLLVVTLLFGTGKVSGLMGDFAKGIKGFKKHMAEDDAPATELPIDRPPAALAARYAEPNGARQEAALAQRG